MRETYGAFGRGERADMFPLMPSVLVNRSGDTGSLGVF